MADNQLLPSRSMSPNKSSLPFVLELNEVTFGDPLESSIRLERACMTLREGELALLKLDRSQKSRGLASLFQGLSKPTSGEVRFLNEDWLGEDYDRHFRMRSKIGRVFEDRAWIENFSVADNLLLASRHHNASLDRIERELDFWTDYFGIQEISVQRPAFVEHSSLQIHQWIRAFLGTPALLILERPMKRVSATLLLKFVEAVNRLRRKGAAVVWFTSNESDHCNTIASPWFELDLRGERHVVTNGDGTDE